MARFLVLAAVVAATACSARAADPKDATAVLDKAIKALGGEEKLGKVKAYSVTTKGTMSVMGTDAEISTKSIVQGIDHVRQEFEGDFGGNKVTGVSVLAKDKGWRSFNDMGMDLEGDMLENQKQNAYLAVLPVTVTPLKGKGFKTELGAEAQVNGKPAVAVKGTGPDGKGFTLYFDKESGLPVKLEAKVQGFDGTEVTQEMVYSEFKEMDGIQKATKMEASRDGQKFSTQRVTEFKVLEKVEASTFTKPDR